MLFVIITDSSSRQAISEAPDQQSSSTEANMSQLKLLKSPSNPKVLIKNSASKRFISKVETPLKPMVINLQRDHQAINRNPPNAVENPPTSKQKIVDDIEKEKAIVVSSSDFQRLIDERNRFLVLCSKSRFYTNPLYKEPWRVLSS